MKKNLDGLIQKIQNELPDLITPEMLLKLGVGDHVRLFRLRESGKIPFLKLSNARILYLKADVIDWLKKTYNSESNACLEECVSNDA